MITPARWQRPALLGFCLCVFGCAAGGGPGTVAGHDNMDAVLWIQSSPEYAATTTGIYVAATAKLRKIAESEPGRVHMMSVVMDVDETVLDNSPYQGQTVLDGTGYRSETWDEWVALRAAAAVPGAVEFIRTSRSLGFHIAFVTNRTCRARPDDADACPQRHDTVANLDSLGAWADADSLYLRGDVPPAHCREFMSDSERQDGRWSSDKTSRRRCVAADRDTVMLIGDQLGDFTAHADRPAAGREKVDKEAPQWGTTWFMLPNPSYGDWLPNGSEDKRAAVCGIADASCRR